MLQTIDRWLQAREIYITRILNIINRSSIGLSTTIQDADWWRWWRYRRWWWWYDGDYDDDDDNADDDDDDDGDDDDDDDDDDGDDDDDVMMTVDASKSSVNPRTSVKVPSTRREDCIKIDGMYRDHIAALMHKTAA